MRAGALFRFGANRTGAAALEFAIVAPLLLALAFSTLEAGWMMTKTILLDRALDIAVRAVRTDKNAPKTQADMKKAVCAEMLIVPGCEQALLIEMTKVTAAADFPSNAATCVDRGAAIQPVVSFTTGEGESIMFVRACLVTDPVAPFIGLGLQMPKDSKGGYSIVSASAFTNEPDT